MQYRHIKRHGDFGRTGTAGRSAPPRGVSRCHPCGTPPIPVWRAWARTPGDADPSSGLRGGRDQLVERLRADDRQFVREGMKRLDGQAPGADVDVDVAERLGRETIRRAETIDHAL